MNKTWFWVLLVAALANTPFALKGDGISAVIMLVCAFLAGVFIGEEGKKDGHH